MKIHILYNFQQGPWGGGNQFLGALRKELQSQGVYEAAPEKADVVLFNSHHCLGDVLRLKRGYPEKFLLHRLGPIFHYHRGIKWKEYDKAIIELTNKISDGVVFQSLWAFEQAKELGFNQNVPYKVIHNAVDSAVFKKMQGAELLALQGARLLAQGAGGKKIKLIAVSWSDNLMKGFDVYKHLDENMDFSRYEMTFVGNSLFEFSNIRHVKPCASQEVAALLKQNDIFVTAAKNEACSNSLIEAISCGLPVVAVDSGSNRELVRGGGELFETKEDVISKIEKVAENLRNYQSSLPEFSIEKTAKDYYDFAQAVSQRQGSAKKVGFREKMLVRKIKLIRYVL